jgi:hypothetical protein
MRMLRFGALLLSSLVCGQSVPSRARADFSIGAPSATTVKSCDDFFTRELNNPADMSDTADVNNFFKDFDVRNLTSTTFSGGNFQANTAASGPFSFQLWSPFICGSVPIGGRYGAKVGLGYENALNVTSALASKYNRLYVRMYHPQVTPGQGYGLRARFDRDCSYDNQVSITATAPLKEGWNVYAIDLSQTPAAGNVTPWGNGDITGLAIEPTQQSGAAVKVDWVRLEDSSSCGGLGVTVPYTATVTNNNDRVMFYLDNDTDPSNGYIKALSTAPTAVSASGSVAIDSVSGVAPGSYYIVAVQDSDYATFYRNNPWDFSSNDDVKAMGDVTGATYTGGTLSGTASTKDSNIFLSFNGTIDTSVYKNLSIKITGSGVGTDSNPVRILWDTGFKDLRPSDPEYKGNGLWNVDLSTVIYNGVHTWTGQIKDFIVRPAAVTGGVSFSLDFVSLRSSGFDSSRSSSALSTFASSSRLVVNAPPVGQITKPNFHSGEALRPWNMNDGDFVVLTNLQKGADPSYPGENWVTYLPDVRRVDGLRGDFFKGANEAGNGDANNHSVFPFFTDSPITFSGDKYRLLCYKMLIDKEFNLRDGHHARVLWENSSSYTSEDLVAITDRWSGNRWFEYCTDMTKTPIDGQTSEFHWSGTIDKFRVDPHEWSYSYLNADLTVPKDATPISVPYYFDYIKLRSYPTAKRAIPLVVDSRDSDGSNPTATFYYSTTRSQVAGTAIAANALTCEGKVCVWDTTSLANGTYYISARFSDGLNSGETLDPVPVIVDNSEASTLAPPTVVLEAPSATPGLYNSEIQVKGYALQADSVNVPVQAVQVLIDGTFASLIDPTQYSDAAKKAYPTQDSSNTGFNQLIDISALASGVHTAEIVAYGAGGAITRKTVQFTKQVSGAAEPIADPEPAGSPVTARVGPPPGAGINLTLGVAADGNNLNYDVGGIDSRCTVLRIKITDIASQLSTGPFTFVQTVSDTSQLTTGALRYYSENIPRLVVPTDRKVPRVCKPQPKKLKTCQKTCSKIKNKKKRGACISSCRKRFACTAKAVQQTVADTTASIQVDCGDGTGTSSTIEVDAATVGNPAKTVPNIATWVDQLRLSGKQR